jgi:hypothetical protein
MGLLSFCLSKTRRRASAAKDACKPGSSRPGRTCDAAPECERPTSLAELIAASVWTLAECLTSNGCPGGVRRRRVPSVIESEGCLPGTAGVPPALYVPPLFASAGVRWDARGPSRFIRPRILLAAGDY